MKKLLILALLFLSINIYAQEQKVHLGIFHDGNTVFGAIQLEKKLRVEGYFYTFDSSNSNSDYTSIGVGAFYTKYTSSTTLTYMGARIGFDDSSKDDGLVLAPAVGFEYFFDKKVSLGADVAYYINDANDDRGIDSAFTLRYYF